MLKYLPPLISLFDIDLTKQDMSDHIPRIVWIIILKDVIDLEIYYNMKGILKTQLISFFVLELLN